MENPPRSFSRTHSIPFSVLLLNAHTTMVALIVSTSSLNPNQVSQAAHKPRKFLETTRGPEAAFRSSGPSVL